MEIQILKCGDCGIETNDGKYWGTGKYLCKKCYDEWTDKKKKESSSDESVSESVIKKLKKGRNKKRKVSKNVKTKIHENGFQNRLSMYIKDN